MKITLVAGARPNFMKIAPIIRAIKSFNRTDQIDRTDQINKIDQINVPNGQRMHLFRIHALPLLTQ